MTCLSGMPMGAAIAIGDMLDNCATVKPGEEVLILAQIDGLHGGDSMVDERAIAWIQMAVQMKGARASVLWIDEPATPHAWRFPPVVKAAMLGCDTLINNSFDLVVEEILEFREFIAEHRIKMVRNFATTTALLCTDWAQTPHELVGEIRYQASRPFLPGLPFVLSDENGTHIEGTIAKSSNPKGPADMPYSTRREVDGYYLPWPEWVHPPVNLADTSGTFIFDSMLSWWSRYIGISPYFDEPVRLVIEDNRIASIEGGREAEALKTFLAGMRERMGDAAYTFDAFHFGVHPNANVTEYQCPNILHRRVIEHSHTSNLHAHIGTPPSVSAYPYWLHCTGDIRKPTLKVGETVVYDRGYLCALDHPGVKAVAEKYPGRPV